MHSYICPVVLEQIKKCEEKLEQLKVDFQFANQKLRDKPGYGLDTKGPFSRILASIEDAEFFLDQFMKTHGLKYLPIPEDQSIN